MRLLVIGGNGQVGFELLRSLARLGDVATTTRGGVPPEGAPPSVVCEPLDVSQLDSIAPLLDHLQPGAVINASAYTAVDRAEDEPEAAFRVNAEAPRVIAQWCLEARASLIHYSTDYVFDGRGRRPYHEGDATGPVSVYGASKCAGEQALAVSGAQHLVLRTAWAYGLRGNNFLRTMLQLGRERDVLHVVAEQVGTPTPAWLIADATARILSQGIKQSGVRHLVASGQTSWYGFAVAIFSQAVALGILERMPRVVPISADEYPTRAKRPSWSVLDTSRLRAEYMLTLPEWRDALRRTLSDESCGAFKSPST